MARDGSSVISRPEPLEESMDVPFSSFPMVISDLVRLAELNNRDMASSYRVSSESRKVIHLPVEASIPAFRAAEIPWFDWLIRRKRLSFAAYLPQIDAESSVEPSSTIMASKRVYVCERSDSSASRRYASALYTGTMTDTSSSSICEAVSSSILT